MESNHLKRIQSAVSAPVDFSPIIWGTWSELDFIFNILQMLPYVSHKEDCFFTSRECSFSCILNRNGEFEAISSRVVQISCTIELKLYLFVFYKVFYVHNILVGSLGIEPSSLGLRGRPSPSKFRPELFGSTSRSQT